MNSARHEWVIMVVEDHNFQRKALMHQIRGLGYPHLLEAQDGEEALAQCQHHHVDILFCDLRMPGMDGMALTRQIRQQFPAITARMPIIALTANTNPVDRQRCRDAGMDDVLDKPMDLQVLTRCVSRHVLKARG